jgi:hypothetical protein
VKADELTIEVGKRCTAWLVCSSRTGKRILDDLGIAHQWDHERRCWMFPIQFAEDVAAHQHRRRRYVALVAVER